MRTVLFLKQRSIFMRILWLHMIMYLCLPITIDRARTSTLLITVNISTHTCISLRILIGKLSYLFIVLMRHTMILNIQYYFLSLNIIPKWLIREIS